MQLKIMNQNNELIGNDSCTKDRVTISYRKIPILLSYLQETQKVRGNLLATVVNYCFETSTAKWRILGPASRVL